ncbi:MAG TPA: hypothetical protein VGC34_01235 [Steroidobacteraceae bacterium]
MNIRKSVLITAAACALTGASLVACATQPPYNPDRLGEAQYARVTGICENVMGLSPRERPSGGNWLGNDRLDYWTSHYRGCIVSLSDSLQGVNDTLVAQQADADCRAKGYRTGSPDLALCVLQTANSHPEPTPSQETAAAATPVSEKLPAVGSYFRASPRETVRREQVACAALGLEPTNDSFKSCVKGLSDTLYAIDHPIN